VTARTVPVSQESAAPLIAPAADNPGLDSAAALVTIPPPPAPAAGITAADVTTPVAPPALAGGIGVAVDSRHVVANFGALDGRREVSMVLAGGDRAQGRLAASDLVTGLALLEWIGGAPLRPLRPRAAAEPRLKAIVDRLIALRASGRGLPATLGLRLQDIDADLATILGDEGVLISALEPGSPAAGLIRPGDVIVAIGSQAVSSVETAQQAIAALPAGKPVPVEVRREGKPTLVSVERALAAGTRPSRPEPVDSPSAAEILTAEQIKSAGVDAGGRVLSIDARPPGGRTAVQRDLRRRRRPALLYVEQDGERFFRVLPR
jgi:membrane-associated protease RseP (regulator of RpoE activity)